MSKPLEWEEKEDRWSHGYRSVEQLSVGYIVVLNQNNQWYVQGTAMAAKFCASPEEGKQLAEQHWQEYIKQALVAVEKQQ